jgi:hypothetical protein
MEKYQGKQVLLKLATGRTLSGVLRGTAEEGFTLKLGVKHLRILPEAVASITALEE